MYLEIKNKILKSNKIAILSHVAPDGDNIGSSLALYNAITNLGKSAEYILDDEIPKIYNFLKGSDKIKKSSISNEFDLVFALDCGDKERLGNSHIYTQNNFVINIDHHISNTKFGDINLVDADACATGELIYKLLMEIDLEIDKAIAECLYTAIVTDTGQFQYSNTTDKTHEIAGDLIRKGANISYVYKNVFQSQPKHKILLIKKALETLEFHCNDMLSCISLTKKQITDSGAIDSDTENIINFARDIEGVEVAVFLKEVDNNKIKVSLRSINKVDVCKIAVSFGGGGHIRAAGCTINDSLQAAKEMVLKAVKEALGGEI